MKERLAGELRLQIHTDEVSSQAIAALRTECEALAPRLAGALDLRFEEGEDEGKYLNIVFDSHSPQDLWPEIKAALYLSAAHGPTLRTKSMALRTGEDGWNDYVLLYHYDSTVPVERLQ
ncbi:MAG: hypothetical protein H6933_02645 [Burkholderiaceae bacterium]|nr:hypothetical protein [Burkholderiaceae bacterium]